MYFPIFIPAQGKTALIVGGGTIASRRASALQPFGFNIIVVAPKISPALHELYKSGDIVWTERPFEPTDLAADIVIAATDDREVNRLIGSLARAQKIPVSVADRKEECTFFFPATIMDKNNIVIGIGSDGDGHAAVKATAEYIRDALKHPQDTYSNFT